MLRHLFFSLFDLVSPCSVISSTTSKKFVFCLVILVRMPKELERLTMVGTYVVLAKLLRSPLLHVEGVFLFKAFLLNQPWLSMCLNPGALSIQAAAEYTEVRGSTYVKWVQFKPVVVSAVTLPWSNIGRKKNPVVWWERTWPRGHVVWEFLCEANVIHGGDTHGQHSQRPGPGGNLSLSLGRGPSLTPAAWCALQVSCN